MPIMLPVLFASSLLLQILLYIIEMSKSQKAELILHKSLYFGRKTSPMISIEKKKKEENEHFLSLSDYLNALTK